MKLIRNTLIIAAILGLVPFYSNANSTAAKPVKAAAKDKKKTENHDDHKGHDHPESKSGKDDHEDHGEHESHDHGKEKPGKQSHEDNERVGPGKGIVSADEEAGFQISPEAEKNFEVKRTKFGSSQLEVPAAAIVTAGTERNLYRFRDGNYKRIDFETVKKTGSTIVVKSEDLQAGDEVVTSGMGLLRIAEIAAFGGAPEGHSH